MQELQDAAEATVSGPLLAEIQVAFDVGLEQDFSLTVDPAEAQTLFFAYPSMSDSLGGCIKPVLRFVFGARGVHLPAEVREIMPYVHQAFPDLLVTGEVDVKVLGVERQFWAKCCTQHFAQNWRGTPLYPYNHHQPDRLHHDRHGAEGLL